VKLSSFPVRNIRKRRNNEGNTIQSFGGFNGKPAGANAQRIQRVELRTLGCVWFWTGLLVVAAGLDLPFVIDSRRLDDNDGCDRS
jgi:hypothetical protein